MSYLAMLLEAVRNGGLPPQIQLAELDFTVDATVQRILPSEPMRLYAAIYSDGASTVTLAHNPKVAAGQGVKLDSADFPLVLSGEGDFIRPSLELYAVGDATATKLYVVTLTLVE